MQFLNLYPCVTSTCPEAHREPLIAVIEVVRAPQPLHEGPMLIPGENPRKRECGFQVIGEFLKYWRADRRLVRPKTGIGRGYLPFCAKGSQSGYGIGIVSSLPYVVPGDFAVWPDWQDRRYRGHKRMHPPSTLHFRLVLPAHLRLTTCSC